jgi:hypothetical protein
VFLTFLALLLLVASLLLLASVLWRVPFASCADVGPSVFLFFLLSTALEFLQWLEFCCGILAAVIVASVHTDVNFPSATVFPPALESLLLLVRLLFQLSLVLLSGLLLMCSYSCCLVPGDPL